MKLRIHCTVRLWLVLLCAAAFAPPNVPGIEAQIDEPHSHQDGARIDSHLGPIPEEFFRRPIPLHDDLRSVPAKARTSGEASAFFRQGLTLQYLYNYLDAARSFHQAIRLDPEFAEAHVGLARAYSSMGASAAARRAMDRAMELAEGADPGTRLRVRLRDSQRRSGDWRDDLDAAVQRHPADVELRLLHAQSVRGGDRIARLRAILETHPDHAGVHHMLTHAFETRGDAERAVEHGAKAALLAPGVAHARHMFGHGLLRTGRVDEAVREFAAADSLERAYYEAEAIPEWYDWHHPHNLHLYGQALWHQGRHQEAEEVLRRRMALETSSGATRPVAAVNLAEFLISRGRFAEALDLLLPLAEGTGSGNVVETAAALAVESLIAAGRVAEAREVYRGVGEPDPGNHLGRYRARAHAHLLLHEAPSETAIEFVTSLLEPFSRTRGPDGWVATLLHLESLARGAIRSESWEIARIVAEAIVAHDPSYEAGHRLKERTLLRDGPAAAGASGSLVGTPLNVADAIGMVHIEDFYGMNDRFVTFSPDGSRFATVVSWGDLERDVIVYSLLVFDVEEALATPRATPVPVLSIPFEGDSTDHNATPIDQLTFLADNRTVAFLGTLTGEPRQVYAVDSETQTVRALTNHDTAVKAYDVAKDGAVRLYAAAVPDDADTARVKRFTWDGFSPYDRDIILPPVYNAAVSTIRGMRTREVRQYFMPAPTPGGEPTLVFDSRQSRRTTPSVWEVAADTATHAMPQGTLVSERELDRIGSFSVDPTGRHAVMWPYILGEHSVDALVHDAWQRTNLYGRSLAAYFGLVDLSTGSIEPLLDQLFVPFLAWDGGQLWAPDGNSILLKTLLPLDAASPEENERRAREPPVWLEVDVPSGDYTPVPVPDQWRAIRWEDGTGDLILRRADSLAVMRRNNGSWGSPRFLGVSEGFNRRRPFATNGRVVIGVNEAPTVPPDLAAFDLSSGATTVLTDLNPQLRDREYGEVEQVQFSTPYDSTSTATLIKPVGFEPGRRYPLVVLHKNERDRPWDRSYLIDGRTILSGHAIQPLAANGFMVLFIGEPGSMRMGTAMEGEVIRVNTEEAIRSLAGRGYVDTLRVGVSGFSRSAYYVDRLLIHSEFPFAAATQIDGGTREYNDRMRPYTDDELHRIQTPLLFQPHGLTRLIYAGSMADRLQALGKPIDILYFHTAPHATRQPRHRWRSLTTHVDWWRFWLQDHEDPDPDKRDQYLRWRHLRATAPADAP